MEQLTLVTPLQVGDTVRHKLIPELVGRVVAIQGQQVKLKLLTRPAPFLRQWFRDRPMPARAENLELI